jgi:hypothetical protein
MMPVIPSGHTAGRREMTTTSTTTTTITNHVASANGGGEDRSHSEMPDPQGLVLLSRRYVMLSSPHGSEPRRRFPITTGKPTPGVVGVLPAGLPRGGGKDDLFIIKNLPLHLASSTRT